MEMLNCMIIHVNYDTSSFLELCLTSNVKCGTVESYKKHHFIHLFTAKHPIVLAVSIDKRTVTLYTPLSHFQLDVHNNPSDFCLRIQSTFKIH